MKTENTEIHKKYYPPSEEKKTYLRIPDRNDKSQRIFSNVLLVTFYPKCALSSAA